MGDHFAQNRASDLADDRTRRHRENDVRARTSGLVRAHAMLAALRGPTVAIRVIEQRREVVIATDDDIAPTTTVSTIWPAHGDELLSPKRAGARSAGSCLDTNDDTINEHAEEPRARSLPQHSRE